MINKRGFTLLEVLIVLMVVAAISGLAINRITSSFRSEARALSWRMASTVKYLYNSAAMENRTIRLVLDFETNSFSAEETSEEFLLERPSEKKEKSKEVKKEEGEKSKEAKGNYIEPLEPTFGSMESPFLETRKLPIGILFKDVHTSHDEKAVTGGRAYIYFFPSGYVEPSIINFKDEADERHISIKINPFSGDADISSEYRSLEGTKEKKKK